MDEDRLDVLIVEDNLADAEYLIELLGERDEPGYTLSRVTCLAEARAHLSRRTVDVVLLDLNLPDSRGLDTVQDVRAVSPDAAVVVLTGVDDSDLGLTALQVGVQDFLVKRELGPDLLDRSIRYAHERQRLLLELEAANEKLDRMTRTDPLTEILNRRGCEEMLRHEQRRARRHNHRLAALLIDLDDFKEINDRYGHAAGDAVLLETARRIDGALRETDLVSRVGGDEFLVLLHDTRMAEARRLAEQLRTTISASPVQAGDASISATISIGMTRVSPESTSLEEILALADPALIRSKRTGKNRIAAVPAAEFSRSDRLRSELLGEDALYATAVPVVRLEDEAVIGYELLARSRIAGFENPRDFFHVVAEERFVTELDRACLRVCAEAAAALPRGMEAHLNLLPDTLLQPPRPELPELVAGEVGRSRRCVDLSDQQVAGDPGDLEEAVTALRRRGWQIAVDDATWNTACVELLVLLRPEIVKMDLQRGREGLDLAKIRPMKRLARICRKLGAVLLCEGIRNDQELEEARKLRFELGQGPLWKAGLHSDGGAGADRRPEP